MKKEGEAKGYQNKKPPKSVRKLLNNRKKSAMYFGGNTTFDDLDNYDHYLKKNKNLEEIKEANHKIAVENVDIDKVIDRLSKKQDKHYANHNHPEKKSSRKASKSSRGGSKGRPPLDHHQKSEEDHKHKHLL